MRRFDFQVDEPVKPEPETPQVIPPQPRFSPNCNCQTPALITSCVNVDSLAISTTYVTIYLS